MRGWISPQPPADPGPGHQRWHTIPIKFAVVVATAFAWTLLSIWLSRPWLEDLSAVMGVAAATVSIAFIAYVPGFMNAFVFTALALDHRPPRIRPASYPPVSVLVATYNEAEGIGDTLTSLARQDYPGVFEVLILDDGSVDGTLAAVAAALEGMERPMAPVVRVIPFPVNAGKASVLNRGLVRASHELIVTVDGDCWLHKDALRHVVERLLADPAQTQAVAGAVMVRNSRDNLLTQSQEWDYFHGIAAVKRMQSMFHGTLVAQGAFSIYRRKALETVGGWPACVGEDIVLTWAFLKQGWRVGYAEDAIAFTNVPTTLPKFAQQRRRWSRGLIEAFKAHGSLLLKPRLSTVFIWWNLAFLPMDVVYTCVFVPGLVLALFGKFYIAGPLTLAVLPLGVVWNLFMFRIERRTFHHERLKVRRNFAGFVFYAFAYNLLVQPICVYGYASELVGLRKTWGTK